MRRILPSVLLGTAFAGLALAAFIKEPVPPASSGHFAHDKNSDAKMDRLSVSFLKEVSRAYLDSMVDSLVVTWPDSSFNERRIVVRGSELLVAGNAKTAYYDLKNQQNVALATSPSYGVSDLVSATLYQKESVPVVLALSDSLRPLPSQISLSAGSSADTLPVLFSEPVKLAQGSGNLEILTSKGTSFTVSYTAKTKAELLATQNLVISHSASERLSSADSVVFPAGFAFDSSDNASLKTTLSLSGISPFRVLFSSMGSFATSEYSSAPIFELVYAEPGTTFPEGRLGLGMDLGNSSFWASVKKLASKSSVVQGDVVVRLEVSVFSHSGTFLTSSSAEIRGDDPRISGGSRVFFLWNFMDGNRRFAGAGAYISRSGVTLLYGGKAIYSEKYLRSWGLSRH